MSVAVRELVRTTSSLSERLQRIAERVLEFDTVEAADVRVSLEDIRDIAHAARRLDMADCLISTLDAHEGAEGWSAGLQRALDEWSKDEKIC